MIKKKNISGVSGVISVIIMVALVLASATVVWTVVSNILSDELGEAQSCFDLVEKITLENEYTCYNSTSGELKFLISVQDVKLDSLLISVSGALWGKNSFEFANDSSTLSEKMRKYNDDYGDALELPKENTGVVYFINLSGELDPMDTTPDSIEIAPKVNGKQCEVVDSISKIDNCLLFVQ